MEKHGYAWSRMVTHGPTWTGERPDTPHFPNLVPPCPPQGWFNWLHIAVSLHVMLVNSGDLRRVNKQAVNADQPPNEPDNKRPGSRRLNDGE